MGFETITSAISVQYSTSWVIKSTGSWSHQAFINNIPTAGEECKCIYERSYITNLQCNQLPVLVSWVKHCTGISHKSWSVWILFKPEFFSGFNFTAQCIKYCDEYWCLLTLYCSSMCDLSYILFQITGQNGHNLRVQSKPIFSFGCLGQVCVDFPDGKVTNLHSHLLTRQAPTE